MFKLNALKMLQGDNKSRGRPAKAVSTPATLEDCAALLKQQGAAVAILAVQDLQAYWLSIMTDKTASNKDKLAASRLYAQSIGAFDARQQERARAPEAYKWADATVVDAEEVSANNSADSND